MRRRALSMLLIASMVGTLLTGCGSSSDSKKSANDNKATSSSESKTDNAGSKVDASKIKVGVIYVGDENEGYTAAHMAGIKEMKEKYGLKDDQIIEKKSVGEDETCYDAAADLADSGCNIIFANSFGHEDYIVKAAGEYPNVQFCHATGSKAASSKLKNMHNYFDSIYEARYVSGVVAGMKLKAMIDKGEITKDKAKIGYVGAYPYAEVISGFTAFYLGAKSVVDSATMEVKYTNSWADPKLEGETATSLIADGCVLISQHADTTGAPSVCEQKGVPVVGYNVDMTSVAPKTALTSPTNNWGAYYEYAVGCILEGKDIDTDWCKGYAENSVAITKLGSACADGTQAKVDEVINNIKSGKLHIFDTSKFTIKGKTLESAKDAAGNELVSDGYYHESEKRSAPSFDKIIDGITVKNK